MKTIIIKAVNTPWVISNRNVKIIKIVGLTLIGTFILCLCAFGSISGLSNTYLG